MNSEGKNELEEIYMDGTFYVYLKVPYSNEYSTNNEDLRGNGPHDANLYLNEELSIQTLITFNYLYPYFTNYLNNLFDLYNEYSYMSNSIKRLNNLFDVESISLNKSNLIVNGDIIFNNVSFKYTDKLILNNISFRTIQH